MKNFKLILSCTLLSMLLAGCGKTSPGLPHSEQLKSADSLPLVFEGNISDLVDKGLRQEAAMRFALNQLPGTAAGWSDHSARLRARIYKEAGIDIDHKLPPMMKETASIKMKGYTVKNIVFQTRPGVFATANLYVPEGAGPFPAVINMLGHWAKGKIDATGPQAVGHTLATSGYVCLTIDPWGAGERSTMHGDFEYHGANLGASLMNIGKPLIGMQITDNIRGVDLLCSLPYVDSTKIGATGASGGGNQTMWLSAADTRIKADVPVVSVGTFESYIMESNCICEQLPDGLTFTEEAGIIALSNAPLLLNHDKDSNPTFFPSQTVRTFANAKKIFDLTGRGDRIAFMTFSLEHGYEREDREAMLGWFDLQLKGTGDGKPRKELPFEQLPEDKLMVFRPGSRDASVVTTDVFCRTTGDELKKQFLAAGKFDTEAKKKDLKELLRIGGKLNLQDVVRFSDSGVWERVALLAGGNNIFPVLLTHPSDPSQGYMIISSPDGKRGISIALVDSLRRKGFGVVIPDLTGTGELTSINSSAYDGTGKLHTLSRAELWLGRTIQGEWVRELDLVAQYLVAKCSARSVGFYGYREAGLAGLFYSALGGKAVSVTLDHSPVSYHFDNRRNVDYFSMGIHLPGFLVWGDVSLVAALSGTEVNFIHPVTMSGTPVTSEALKETRSEFDKVIAASSGKGKTTFTD